MLEFSLVLETSKAKYCARVAQDTGCFHCCLIHLRSFGDTFVPCEVVGPLVFLDTRDAGGIFCETTDHGPFETSRLRLEKVFVKGSIVLLLLRVRACSGAACLNGTFSLVYSFLAFSVVWHCGSARCVSSCFTATDIPIASSGVTLVA